MIDLFAHNLSEILQILVVGLLSIGKSHVVRIDRRLLVEPLRCMESAIQLVRFETKLLLADS